MENRDSNTYQYHTSMHSLLNCAVHAVVKNLPLYTSSLIWLPTSVKDRVIHLLSRRGTLSDSNLEMLLHDGVRNLDLSESKINDEGLQIIGTKCQRLQKINLNSLEEPRLSISSLGVQSVAKGCNRLQIVYLWRCANITDDAVVAIATHCRYLREINLGCCSNITDISLQAIGEHCSLLKILDFSRTKVTDQGVLALCNGECKNTLEEICMKSCKQVTDEAVEAFIIFCQKISILIFDGCPLITERSRLILDEKVQSSTHLRHVTWSVY